jgi:hypothetical protein
MLGLWQAILRAVMDVRVVRLISLIRLIRFMRFIWVGLLRLSGLLA